MLTDKSEILKKESDAIIFNILNIKEKITSLVFFLSPFHSAEIVS